MRALQKADTDCAHTKERIEKSHQITITDPVAIADVKKRIAEAEQILNTELDAFSSKETAKNKILLQKHQTATAEKLAVLSAKLVTLQAKLHIQTKLEEEKNKHTIQTLENALAHKPDDAELKQQLANATGYREMVEQQQDVLLRVQNLTMMFGGLKAVDQLSFDVKKGEIFGLIGPNGAGKTTVFNCITQFYKQNKGNILYRNVNNEVISLRDYKVHDVIKEGIVRTFQNVELIWELNVLDNLLVGAHTFYRSGLLAQVLHLPILKREEAVYRMRALDILKRLDLLPYQAFYPLGLPYGILKRVELARTLMTNPKLIILDEPAAGLNDAESQDLANVIKIIQKDFDCTIFLVEHDMGLVMDICDTVCAISFGKKLAIGTPEFIQQNKAVQESYLGGE
jgi:branched-chain amino acid transport system ATP-binding protein